MYLNIQLYKKEILEIYKMKGRRTNVTRLFLNNKNKGISIPT